MSRSPEPSAGRRDSATSAASSAVPMRSASLFGSAYVLVVVLSHPCTPSTFLHHHRDPHSPLTRPTSSRVGQFGSLTDPVDDDDSEEEIEVEDEDVTNDDRNVEEDDEKF